jgi:hypothetical protein
MLTDNEQKLKFKERMIGALIQKLNQVIEEFSKMDAIKSNFVYEDFLDIFAGGIAGMIDFLIYGYKRIPNIPKSAIISHVATVMIGLNRVATEVLKEPFENIKKGDLQKADNVIDAADIGVHKIAVDVTPSNPIVVEEKTETIPVEKTPQIKEPIDKKRGRPKKK